MLGYGQFRVNRRQCHLNHNTFLYQENIGKFLFMKFRPGLKVLMSIERFASTRNYLYNTICGFSILYCCLFKISWLDDTSKEDKIESASTRWYRPNSFVIPRSFMLGILHKTLTAFSNCTADSGKRYLLPGVLVPKPKGIRICTSLCLHTVIPTRLKDFAVDSLRINDFILPLVDKKISFVRVTSHEPHSVPNYRYVILTVCSKVIQAKMKWYKAKHHWPFLREFTSHWWIPWTPLKMQKAFPYHDVIMFRFICTLWLWHRRCKRLSIFTPGAFLSPWQRCCNL